MINLNKYIEISVPLSPALPVWEGDPQFVIEKISEISENCSFNLSSLKFSAHTGTHIDAPCHYIKNGKDVSQIDVSNFIGIVKVFEIKNPNIICLNEIKDFNIESGDKIIFKTKNSNSEWYKQKFKKKYVHLDLEAAEYLVNQEASLVGIDYLSIAGFNDGEKVHKTLLQNNTIILEGLYLKNVKPTVYQLICLPLSIKGADGAPARAFLYQM